jgi:hypothetical protein
MEQWIGPVVIALLGLASAMTASESKGDEFYYVMIFGSQSQPKLLQYTHTHDPEPFRPMAGRQYLADPAAGPGPLSDRVHPTAADPQTNLRPLPLPGLRTRSACAGGRGSGRATLTRNREKPIGVKKPTGLPTQQTSVRPCRCRPMCRASHPGFPNEYCPAGCRCCR